MASSLDQVQLMQCIDEKLKHMNECFECFKEDFENMLFVGNNVKMQLKNCCVDMIVPFDKLLDKFMDILTAFDRGLKSNLEGWLKIESHLADKYHKNFKLVQLCDLSLVCSQYCLSLT